MGVFCLRWHAFKIPLFFFLCYVLGIEFGCLAFQASLELVCVTEAGLALLSHLTYDRCAPPYPL